MENLKKISLSFVASMFIFSSAQSGMSGFVQNNLGTSITSENAGYYKSQVSGFISGGSARVRWGGGETIQPFSVQAPNFNVGCSGIDMVFGGFSYLNFEYLVEKLKKIAAAAPAFAFKIALSTLCKDCDTIMSELEKIANAINSMNFDTCQMTNNWTNNIAGMLNLDLQGGQSDSWLTGFKNVSEGTQATVDRFVNWINGSNPSNNGDKPAKQLLSQGSLLKKALENGKDAFFKKAFGEQEYEDIGRGLLGDIVSYTSKETSPTGEANKETKVLIIRPTIGAERFIDLVWNSDNKDIKSKQIDYTAYIISEEANGLYKEPVGKKAVLKMDKSMKEILIESFKTIVGKISSQTALDSDDMSFISSAPLPVVDILNIEAIGMSFGDEIYEFVALLMFDAFIQELFREYTDMLFIIQNEDKKFALDHQEDIREMNAQVRSIRTEINKLMDKIQLKDSSKNKKLNEVRNLLKEYFKLSDSYNAK
ncbi:conjugal transfer protein TraH [Campylobacter insulaenigrae]|uniref:conjugal transfer protein TraH n=1 Tax=Campylobacter insulaenigrae TaxID=260714 RepID=UPI0021523F3B|nr:conjugal transfer protein TraH [Campylobacter insulaenigrae]MCR6574440.1 conjugal transfer protein TraH [Campylobacter insulaenigrae]